MRPAQHLGHVRRAKYFLALLAVIESQSVAPGAWVLRVHEKPVMTWLREFCCYGVQGAPHRPPTGRPPQLPPPPQATLGTWMEEGPVKAGCSGACWRSPMMQQVLDDRFGVLYHVFSIAQLLKNLDVSSQKAACVPDHLNADTWHAWRMTTWPQMLRRAKEQKALRLCGDDASVPQWGTLTSTWARRGQQPQVTTSGKRTGDQVFGLIAGFTGQFFAQGQAGRLHSTAYVAFLRRVREHTTQPILLLQDGARDHTRAKTQACFAPQAARLQGVQLPTYAPDDNPMETLWKKIKQQETHRPSFPTFEALTEQVEQVLLTLANLPEEILALCGLPTALAQAAEVGCVDQLFS